MKTGITTMINGGGLSISNEALSETVNLHKFHPVFLRRKITTWCIEGLSNILNLEIGLSFVIVNFFFLFLSGVLIYFLSKQITQNSKFSLISMIAYFLCFSNLFAFFPPVYTYDEPLQFCFILSSLLLFFKNKYWWFIFLFSISLIIRESGVILLPGLFFVFIYNFKKSITENLKSLEFLKKTSGILIPIVVYLFYVYIIMVDNDSKHDSKQYFLQRFSYIKWNLQSFQFAIESICSMLLIYALPLYFLCYYYRNKKQVSVINSKLIKAFLITLIINTLIVFLNTKAREVRLFVIPLFYFWPIFGAFFLNDFKLLFNLSAYRSLLLNKTYVFYVVILNILTFIFSFVLYKPTSGPRLGVFNLYLFISFSIIIAHFIINKSKPKTHQ
ncbi:hypothetical protein [Thalassobellus sediminis]|uniref:hypothetical protein n=1 Tax=Thalassobellus sediminis TaxID=3367753 RepID=UPI0037976C51